MITCVVKVTATRRAPPLLHAPLTQRVDLAFGLHAHKG